MLQSLRRLTISTARCTASMQRTCVKTQLGLRSIHSVINHITDETTANDDRKRAQALAKKLVQYHDIDPVTAETLVDADIHTTPLFASSDAESDIEYSEIEEEDAEMEASSTEAELSDADSDASDSELSDGYPTAIVDYDNATKLLHSEDISYAEYKYAPINTIRKKYVHRRISPTSQAYLDINPKEFYDMTRSRHRTVQGLHDQSHMSWNSSELRSFSTYRRQGSEDAEVPKGVEGNTDLPNPSHEGSNIHTPHPRGIEQGDYQEEVGSHVKHPPSDTVDTPVDGHVKENVGTSNDSSRRESKKKRLGQHDPIYIPGGDVIPGVI